MNDINKVTQGGFRNMMISVYTKSKDLVKSLQKLIKVDLFSIFHTPQKLIHTNVG